MELHISGSRNAGYLRSILRFPCLDACCCSGFLRGFVTSHATSLVETNWITRSNSMSESPGRPLRDAASLVDYRYSVITVIGATVEKSQGQYFGNAANALRARS